jgi:hypothetical protein
MSVEQNLIAFAGAEQITGRDGRDHVQSNDLAAGLDRMATDLSAYYLLGYQPEPSAPGKWHKLEVRVNRPGSRGACAAADTARSRDGRARARQEERPRRVAELVTASLAGGARDILPAAWPRACRRPTARGRRASRW